jgi:hypothetical protein
MRLKKRYNLGKSMFALPTMALILLSVGSLSQSGQIFLDAEAAPSNFAVSKVTASGYESESTNVPANTIDNKIETRWSNLGVGSWISFDLGKTQTVSHLDIAWFRGDIRTTDFVISVSTDGSSFSRALSAESSGDTDEFERYDFSDRNARYVRITVNGNTQNEWASISEVDIYGSSTTTGSGGSDGSTGSASSDKFGIKKLNPTVPNGREWFSTWDNGIKRDVLNGDKYDTEFRPSGTRTKMYVTGDSDGSLEVRGDWPRFNIIDPERSKMWRNVEVTYYVKLVSQNQGRDDKGIAAEVREGDYGPSPDGYDRGYSYNHGLRYNGRVFFQKEVADHCLYTSGIKTVYPWDTSNDSFPTNKWLGFKYVVRNADGGKSVNMVLYVDKTNGANGGTWEKLIEYTDSGGWKASLSMDCIGKNLVPKRPLDWVINNATYDVRFRSDYANPVMWKDASIREIASLP